MTSLRVAFTSWSSRSFAGIALLSIGLGMTGCGPTSVMMHSQTGDPIVIQESAWSANGCKANLEEEAHRLGVSLRSTDVKGSIFGDSLFWPFVKGYVCLGTGHEIPPGIVGKPYLYQG